ncbi:MAG TPA: rhomboid family intramembrane serine protease [Opitutus sp.]|nr:rhomboid family intramembrane serine protease [Opitutus sp.]
MLDYLERKFGRIALQNVTLYLIIGQVFVTLTWMLGLLDQNRLVLVPYLVLHGEPWRLITFLFLPPPVSGTFGLMLLPFAWWLFYLMGNALEHYWGAFRYNIFLLLGIALTVGAAFLSPMSPASNLFLAGTVFLAFAWLNPDFEIMLFFILPVKIKWLAAITAVGYAVQLVVGPATVRWQVLASIGNFLVFFGRDIVNAIRYRQRSIATHAKRVAEERKGPEARHRCHICGKTDLTNPEMDFRYCSKCAGDQCYCPEHIFNHEHVTAEPENGEKA